MSIHLARVNEVLELPEVAPWPECFTPRDLAKLQTWRDEYIPGLPGLSKEARLVVKSLNSSCPSELQYTGRVMERSAHTLQMRSFVGEVQRDESGNFSASHSTEDAGAIDRPAETYLQQEKVIYREGFSAWLKAQGVEPSPMTRAWLDSGPQLATPAPAAATPMPVVADSNAPLPLATGDIAFCFDGIRWNEQEWRKPLGDKPKWLRSCVVTPAQRGVSETRWNPILIAAWLVDKGHAKQNSIRARFQTKPQLKDWLEAWKTYEAENFDTP